ncbi:MULTISPECIES: pheST operon leader peptide PheM [Xenorhabdus]|nr:pheST operon leader peptide PheM [Xenorhabdus sp. BG5]
MIKLAFFRFFFYFST